MTLALRVLIGLVAGFLLGLALVGSSSAAAAVTLQILAPIGTIFVNLIRMTVIPLVVSMLIAGVGGMTASGGLGRTGIRAAAIAVALLTVAAIGSVLVAIPIFARVSIDQGAALALRSATAGLSPSGGAGPADSAVAQWFIDLVPQNIVKAAADGAMLPLIIFAVLFGLALARVSDGRRAAVLRGVEGIAEAMQRLVGWILELAPVGVFALAVPLAARLGLAAAGAVIAYIVVVVLLTIVAAALLLYPLGIVASRMPASAFFAYCAPAQAIAFAARSSLAGLPVILESAERAGLSRQASRVVLPLAVTLFHFGAAVAQTVGVVFLARLFGVTLTPPQLATIVLAVVLASFAVPGIPGGSIIAITPVLAAANLPIEGVGILLAVDTIPDMFRTTANITGALTLVAILPKTVDESEPTGQKI
jgi:proton glutamate symport protein